MIVGLTGGIGSGKTTIANMFADLGIDIVDADIVARQVVEPNSFALTQITDYFGQQVILSDGQLNRAKLREIVFDSTEKKQWLNNLLHPIIREEMLKQLAACSSAYALLVAPLLFENNLDKQVNRTLVIDVPESVQLERTLNRDNSSAETIKNIIAAQISRKDRLAKADDVIDNSKDLKLIQQQVNTLHHQYLSQVKQTK